jgi:2-alkyl-3-oxoalkanoate reductase
MKVFVAGGAGAVGARLVPQLVAAGHEVTATARTGDKLAAIEAQGAKGAVMDGLDRDSVLAAVAAAAPAAIVHEMTGLAGKADLRRFDRWFATTSRLRTEGTDHLLEAAARGDVGRLLAQGYTGWPNERSSGPVKTEDDPLDPDPPAAMRETLAANRYQERTWVEAGGLVLRYGSLYGPGTSEDEFVELARKRQLPIVGDGAGVWSFIHVDDAAAATVRALDHGTAGVYNVVDDDPAPSAEWIPALAERCGAKPPRHLPKWLVRPMIGAAGVSMMCEIRGSSNAKAKRELGWAPAHPSWRGVLGSVA